jgi:hypothetical protein
MRTILEVGKKYNDWLIISFDKVDERRRRRYICQCECGYETSLVASRVFHGKTKRCKNCRALKLQGEQICDWTVLKRLPNDRHGKSMWLCRCKCGNERSVGGNNLIRHSSKCCFECGHNKTVETEIIPSSWWYKTMKQAQTRKREWSITEEDAIEVLEKQNYKCTLTGIELTFKPIMTASIDRIENEKGYTKENIQWVHKHINIMKHRYAQEYFINMCHMVSKHQN